MKRTMILILAIMIIGFAALTFASMGSDASHAQDSPVHIVTNSNIAAMGALGSAHQHYAAVQHPIVSPPTKSAVIQSQVPQVRTVTFGPMA